MTDREFCDWVRTDDKANRGDVAVIQRLIEATDRLAKAADEIDRLSTTIDSLGSLSQCPDGVDLAVWIQGAVGAFANAESQSKVIEDLRKDAAIAKAEYDRMTKACRELLDAGLAVETYEPVGVDEFGHPVCRFGMARMRAREALAEAESRKSFENVAKGA